MMVRLAFQPSDMASTRLAVREWVNDAPLLIPSLVALGFGIVLMLPFDTFSTSPTFNVMRAMMSAECVWGAIFTIIGAFHVAAWVAWPQWYRHAAVMLFAVFQTIAVTFALSVGLASTGTVAYTGFALLSLWGPFHAARRN